MTSSHIRSLLFIPIRTLILTLVLALLSAGLFAAPAHAQEEEEGPGQRYATVTFFQLPLQVRDKVVPYIQEYVEPYMRLNPHVVTFRVLAHNWGSKASEIAFYREYEAFEDINAECGSPCEEYQKNHPEPEEGDEDYEAFQEAERLYQKYYSDHRDEIYVIPMGAAKTEGENIGTVGPSEEEGEEN